MVWRGRLDDLKATDPRQSNLLYSVLIGPPPQSAPEDGSTLRPPPVTLDFRYVKEKGRGGRIAGVPGTSPEAVALARAASSVTPGSGCPWESSVLSLDFSRLSVAYVQPLWLEAIDFLWEGVLGAAVWGGSSEPEEEAGAGKGSSDNGKREGRREAGTARGSWVVCACECGIVEVVTTLPSSLLFGFGNGLGCCSAQSSLYHPRLVSYHMVRSERVRDGGRVGCGRVG